MATQRGALLHATRPSRYPMLRGASVSWAHWVLRHQSAAMTAC